MEHQKKFSLLAKSFRNISIRNKIFLLNAVVLFISLAVFAYNAIRISNQAIESKATKNAARELKLVDKSLQIMMKDIENYVRILSIDNKLQNQMELKRHEFEKHINIDSVQSLDIQDAISASISNVVEPNTYIAAASIMTLDHTLLDIGYADNTSCYKVFDGAMMDHITATKTPVWTGLFNMKFKYGGNAEDVFGVAKTIIGKDTGSILGTAILYVKEKDIASSYLDNITEKDNKFFIVDDQGNIISSQDKNDLYRKFDAKQYFSKNTPGNFPVGGSIISNINGKRVLATVNHFDKLNWNIISIIPIDEITIENREITRLIIVFSAVSLMFAFIVSFLLSYTISRPILNLVGIMKGIKLGDFSLRANFEAKDEIGLLGEGFNNLMDRINSLMEEIYNEQKLKRENEFKLLQSQIKPHFLYNTIETIISQIKIGLYQNAIITAKSLAGFYRISLSKGNDIITIDQEIRLINNYLSIQKQRYVEYMDFNLNIDDNILGYSIPKLTLQPLIENSIYHGIKQKSVKGNVSIHGYLEQDTIKIEVFDNGIGMEKEKIFKLLHSPAETNKKSDFGLSNVDSRLKLLYGEKYGLEIESKVGEYTKVTVILPVRIP